jgi:hypothetical protein
MADKFRVVFADGSKISFDDKFEFSITNGVLNISRPTVPGDFSHIAPWAWRAVEGVMAE